MPEIVENPLLVRRNLNDSWAVLLKVDIAETVDDVGVRRADDRFGTYSRSFQIGNTFEPVPNSASDPFFIAQRVIAGRDQRTTWQALWNSISSYRRSADSAVG